MKNTEMCVCKDATFSICSLFISSKKFQLMILSFPPPVHFCINNLSSLEHFWFQKWDKELLVFWLLSDTSFMYSPGRKKWNDEKTCKFPSFCVLYCIWNLFDVREIMKKTELTTAKGFWWIFGTYVQPRSIKASYIKNSITKVWI